MPGTFPVGARTDNKSPNRLPAPPKDATLDGTDSYPATPLGGAPMLRRTSLLRAPLRRLLVLGVTATAAITAPLAISPAAHAATTATYSEPLTTAINDLTVATEVRTGYSRDLFKTWIDADGDGCNTRYEVLIQEADDPPTVGSGCSLTGGRWYSYYDGLSWTNTSDIDIDHVVPLAEAWDSGARSWSAATREAYANDLGDYRTLVGVTDNLNQSKGDQDIAEWQPPQQKCRYLREYVAVKHRWKLTVDSAEKAFMKQFYSDNSCANSTITVTLAL